MQRYRLHNPSCHAQTSLYIGNHICYSIYTISYGERYHVVGDRRYSQILQMRYNIRQWLKLRLQKRGILHEEGQNSSSLSRRVCHRRWQSASGRFGEESTGSALFLRSYANTQTQIAASFCAYSLHPSNVHITTKSKTHSNIAGYKNACLV